MENAVAQMLRCNGHKLYFYSRSDSQHRENHMEIDFLITEKKKIVPIEVKSGNYRSHFSLDKFRTKYSAYTGNSYILYGKDLIATETSDSFKYNHQDNHQDTISQKILGFCASAKTKKEIAEFLGYKDLRNFTLRYLNP